MTEREGRISTVVMHTLPRWSENLSLTPPAVSATQSPPTVSSTFTKTATAHCVRLGVTFCHFVVVFSHLIHNRSLTKKIVQILAYEISVRVKNAS